MTKKELNYSSEQINKNLEAYDDNISLIIKFTIGTCGIIVLFAVSFCFYLYCI